MGSKDGRSFVNISIPEAMKTGLAALAARRGVTVSGLGKVLFEEALDADAAERAARPTALATAPERLGAARNVTTRMLTGSCLHPAHRRERWGTSACCGACGATSREVPWLT